MEPGPSERGHPRPRRDASGPSRLALAVLVVLAVLSPWPMGSAHPLAVGAIALLALLGSLLVVAIEARKGAVELPRVVLWPFAGLGALAVFQRLPLPAVVHRLLAPGSWDVWHPGDSAVAAVLGNGAHPISIHPEATTDWLVFFVSTGVLALLAAPALGSRPWAARAAAVVVLGGLAVALFGIVARLAYGSLLFGLYAVPTISPFGPFVSKNHFAGYVEMSALLGLGLASGLADEGGGRRGILGWTEGPGAARIVAAYGAVGVMFLAVLVSQSRGGVVSILVGGLCFALLRSRGRTATSARRVSPWLGIAAGGAAVVLALWLLPEEAQLRLQTMGGLGDDSSASYRMGIWRDSLGLAASSPLVGSGLGAYGDGLPRFKTGAGALRVEHAENDYLELLAEAGLLGFLLVVAGLFLNTRALRRGFAERRDRLLRGLAKGAAAAVCALAAHSLVDFNLRIPSNALLFVFLLALLAGTATEVARAESWLARGGTLAVVAGALLLAIFSWPARLGPPEASPPPGLRSGVTKLKIVRLEGVLTDRLRRRPARAEDWLYLAWLRTIKGDPATGTALARHAVELDPQRTGLREAAARYLEQAPSKP